LRRGWWGGRGRFESEADAKESTAIDVLKMEGTQGHAGNG